MDPMKLTLLFRQTQVQDLEVRAEVRDGPHGCPVDRGKLHRFDPDLGFLRGDPEEQCR